MVSDTVLAILLRVLLLGLGLLEQHLMVVQEKLSKGGVSPSVTPVEYNK